MPLTQTTGDKALHLLKMFGISMAIGGLATAMSFAGAIGMDPTVAVSVLLLGLVATAMIFSKGQ